MNVDRLIKEALEAEVADVHAPPMHEAVITGRRRRPDWRWRRPALAVASVAAGAAIVFGLVAALDPEDETTVVSDQPSTTDAEPAPEDPAPTRCPDPPFRPTYLPESARDGQDRPPARSHEEGKAILIWRAEQQDGGASVTLVRHLEPPPAEFGGPPYEEVQVRGRVGHLVWIGDPGVGEVAIFWSEGQEPCQQYSLHLLAPGLGEFEAEDELRRIAASL